MSAATLDKCQQATEAADFVTVLQSRGPKLAKTWKADGSVDSYDNTLWVKATEHPVNDIFELSALLRKIEIDPTKCVIRGRLKSDWKSILEQNLPAWNKAREKDSSPLIQPGPGWTLRRKELFEDVSHHWMLCDEDKFEPLVSDPVTDPIPAIEEFVVTRMGESFSGVSYHWQLSNSAGHSKYAGKLRAHLWFWLDEKRTSPELKAWASSRNVLDASVYNPVQVHYTAAPVFAEGIENPVPVRSGLVSGLVEDTVTLVLSNAERAAAKTPSKSKHELIDPREKAGLIGAFHRAYSIEDVVDKFLAEQFEWATENRLTWLGGGGAGEGAYVREDRQGIGASHNTWPDGPNRSHNKWDLVRIFKFGHLDDDLSVSLYERDNNPTDLPSHRAMSDWAAKLPEIVALQKGEASITSTDVIEKLRKLPNDEVLDSWLADTVLLGKGAAQEVVDEVSRLTNKGKRILTADLIEERARLAQARKVEMVNMRAGNRLLLPYQPEDRTRHAAEVEGLIVKSAEPGEYVSFGGILSHVVLKELPYTHLIDDEEGAPLPVPQVEPLGKTAVLARVEEVVAFCDLRDGVPSLISVPDKIVDILIEKQDHAAPKITGLVTHPVVLPAGEILADDGLHAGTGLFLSGASVESVRPYDMNEAQAALIRLRASFLEGFEFASDLDGDVALAGLFTGVQRRLLDMAPGLGVLASAQASGKTTLARRIHVLLTGRDMPVATFPQGDEAEVQKRLLSLLLRAPAMVCFDNITDGTTFRSSSIAAAMTGPTIEQRVLGLSRDASCPTNVLFVITGNNLALGPDEVTRWMVARLAPSSARPEERTFKNPDVVAHAVKMRSQVLRDVVGIVAGYLATGQRMETKSRFAKWDRMVRQPMLWAGACDVAETFQRNTDAAEHVLAHESLMTALREVYGADEFKAADLVKVLRHEVFGVGEEVIDRLKSALENLRTRDVTKVVSVGRALASIKGRVGYIGEDDARLEVRLAARVKQGETYYSVAHRA